MNAHARKIEAAAESAEALGQPQPDGSLLITSEQLARLGNGDPKRGRRQLRLMLEAERQPEVFSGPTPKPAKVRFAEPKDEEGVLALAILDYEENAKHIAPLHEDTIRRHIQAGTRRRGGIVGVIDGEIGKPPVGFCMILPAQWWFSKAHFLHDATMFVHPDHRKSTYIDDLLQFGRWVGDEWSKAAGFQIYTVFGVMGTKRVFEKVMLYKRKLRESGRVFVYPDPTPVGDR